MKTEYQRVLLIFKTKEIPNFDEMFELYYNYENDSYDVTYFHNLTNDKNQLVVMYGTSIIVLDINTFEVISYVSSDSIGRYGVNIFYRDGFYVVEDIEHKLTFFDENLVQITEENDIITKIKSEILNK